MDLYRELDRLSPMDTGFFDVEDDVNQMHIGSVMVMAGPAPPFDRLREMVIGKLPLIPRYRQVMRRVALSRPVWVDDPEFDVDYHLHRVAVPGPGDFGELERLVGDLMACRLDQHRSLWELWMVEGLEGDSWAIVAKVHHGMADGVGGVELLRLILDTRPDAAPLDPIPWRPAAAPSSGELFLQSLSRLRGAPGRAMEGAKVARAEIRDLTRGLGALARMASPASASSLNGSIGRNRRWTATSVPVTEVKEVRARTGASFNDVVLASVSRGFQILLEKRGEPLQSTIRTLMPVSVRARDGAGLAVGDGTLANKVSGVDVELPIAVSDPIRRIRDITSQTSSAKRPDIAGVAHTAASLSRYVPPALARAGGRLAAKAPLRLVNTVTTNIPGPQFPLYAAGREMLFAYPYVPIAMQVRIAVAMLSYNGGVHFGITGDYDHAPDIDVLAEGINMGMDEMLAAVGAPSHSEP